MINNLDYILDTFNNNRFDMDITEDDLYLVGDKLFVNQKGEIYIYEFPMIEYFEATDSFFNISTLGSTVQRFNSG